MLCIFCQEEREPSKEHIIPETLGGSVVIFNVCEDCNSKLGSKVDSALHKHRHIYDAYEKLQLEQKPNFKFRFNKSYFESSDERKVTVRQNSQSKKIVPTKVAENEFIIDAKDNKFIVGYMKKKGMRKGYTEEYINKHIDEYLNWSKTKNSGDQYFDDQFELRLESCTDNASRITEMVSTTPHRFLAKACVEFAWLLGLQDKIQNLDILRQHARYGTHLKQICCYEEKVWDKSIPYHIISFHNNQFQIRFFGNYGFAIEIDRETSESTISIANDIFNKVLLVCQREADGLLITNKTIQFD